ncbi:MAG: PEP-CTERM sorting domain-containing protein [Phycisphaerae bacterium]|nr:PEP-CTERM sorting domain-containing protein [Phycisphaerae bacterium]
MGNTPSRRRDLDQKLLAYSATAGAALVVAQQADGNIIHSGLTNITIDAGNPSVSLDLDGGGVNDVTFSFQYSTTPLTNGMVRNWQLRLQPAGTNNFMATSASGLALRLGAGSAIAAGTQWFAGNGLLARRQQSSGSFPMMVPTYHYMTTVMYSSWRSGTMWTPFSNTWDFGSFHGQRGYVGFRFDIAGGSTHYAWIDFEGAADASSGTIRGWAYESAADTGIEAGAIPEPGSLALLALGAAGVLAMRKGRSPAPQERAAQG